MTYNKNIETVIEQISAHFTPLPLPSVVATAGKTPDPFKILIATLISLRTKDKITETASTRLFALAGTVKEMSRLSIEQIQEAIYPAGFYKNKSRQITEIVRILQNEYAGNVPGKREELLKLPGVGLKTANLTLGLGFRQPYICVDTHVHRIPNRIGWIRTTTPEETEQVLMDVLPKKWWIDINHLLVIFGQNICKPVSPFCSQCPVSNDCMRSGVTTHR